MSVLYKEIVMFNRNIIAEGILYRGKNALSKKFIAN
jgi:hypothetical protein